MAVRRRCVKEGKTTREGEKREMNTKKRSNKMRGKEDGANLLLLLYRGRGGGGERIRTKKTKKKSRKTKNTKKKKRKSRRRKNREKKKKEKEAERHSCYHSFALAQSRKTTSLMGPPLLYNGAWGHRGMEQE